MRTKLLAIVAILWAATVGAISIVFYATRPNNLVYLGNPWADPPTTSKFTHPFDWSAWGAWVGGVTVAALAASAIIVVLARTSD